MIDGAADTNPEINRPPMAPATEGTSPTTIHEMQYTKDAKIYTDFLPKASEYGGKIIPPKACPNW